jgi:outer membrane putative beta-barrel porin/alpha-amylase
MEPRAFSASPIDTNFLIASYQRITGGVSLDPSLPVTGVKATINTGFLAYDRTFDLFGQTASAAIVLPYVQADLSGQVDAQGMKISRSGLGDLKLRFTENLLGGPALTPEGFAQRVPTTTLGVSLAVVAPTGDYDSAHLINISSNRWAFKPEIGLSQPIGDWFSDAAAGVWVFTDNTDFFRGHVRSQDALWVFQLHAGYNFQPGLWLAADGTYYTGGRTSINGVANHDVQAVSRYGLTLSVPLAEGFSAKLAWSSWLTAHKSGNFDTFGVSLQYRWFDP